MAENFDDFAFRIFRAFRIGGNMDNHFMAFDSTAVCCFRNKNIAAEPFVIGYDKSEMFAFDVCADKFCLAALKNAHNGSFLALA